MSSQAVILSTGEGGEYAWSQVPSGVGGWVCQGEGRGVYVQGDGYTRRGSVYQSVGAGIPGGGVGRGGCVYPPCQTWDLGYPPSPPGTDT